VVYAVQPLTAADAEAEQNIKEMFTEIAGDDLEVDPWELRYILNNVFMKRTLTVSQSLRYTSHLSVHWSRN